MAPKVSSWGQLAKCVRCRCSVCGWKTAFSAIYIQPAKPKTNSVRVRDWRTLRIVITQAIIQEQTVSLYAAGWNSLLCSAVNQLLSVRKPFSTRETLSWTLSSRVAMDSISPGITPSIAIR